MAILGLDGRPMRSDGYVNMLTRYGTSQDNSTAYSYKSGGLVPDPVLTEHYESNGLFGKIIDAPAEEAIKHGFTAELKKPEDEELLNDALDALNWEEKAATAIKWARLYGGAIIVMLINDGRGIDEPLNLYNIRSIDGVKVYERAIVQPDWAAALYGEPRYYQVSSYSGFFHVHASRCLVFKNGILPEHTMNAQYRFWGLPEYLRIKNELRECSTAHGHGVRLLERSVQAVYSMQGLSDMLSTDGGEDEVLKRLHVIDMARSILNSIAIDAEGEAYDFKSIPFSGVKDIIDTTCNMLSAVTNIPQTVLFGRSPAGENATGKGDLENYYNLVERIQKMMLRGSLNTLIDIIFRAALAKGKIGEKPKFKIKFKPLWSLNETETAQVEQTKAAAAQAKAQTAQMYVELGALDPSEVRKALAGSKEFDIEKMLDDTPEDDLMSAWGQEPRPGGGENESEYSTDKEDRNYKKEYAEYGGKPEHIKERAERNKARREMGLKVGDPREVDHKKPLSKGGSNDKSNLRVVERKTNRVKGSNYDEDHWLATDGKDTAESVGVIVLNATGDGILCGIRSDNKLIGGPGGNIQEGETPAQAAIRETREEFGITPLNLRRIGQIKNFEYGEYGEPLIYLCTEYEGEPRASKEISSPYFFPLDEFEPAGIALFPPFEESLKLLGKIPENLLISAGDGGKIKLDADEGWKTLKNGEHILLGKGGKVIAGAGGKFNGKTLKAAFGKKRKPKQTEQSSQSPRQTIGEFASVKSVPEVANAIKTLGVPNVALDNFDVATANATSEAIHKTLQDFPELKIEGIGSFSDARKIFEEVEVRKIEEHLAEHPEYDDELKSGYREAIAPRIDGYVDELEQIAGETKAIHLKGVVLINDKYTKSFEQFTESTETEKIFNWRSTDSVKGTIDHEIGHAITRQLQLSSNAEIQELFTTKGNSGIKKGLSEYGTTNVDEFISEAWAEYRNSEKPRRTAREIGKIIEAEYENKYRNEGQT
jgi:phage-related protein (TIGR01555 family)